MAVNIVTGMTGTEHITSDDFRAMNASIFGTGKIVLAYGQQFAATIVNNNQVRISDGMCMNQGTQMGIELTDYEDLAIENGVSGSNRNDLIAMRYTRNVDTSIENASLTVIKGTAGATATDPTYQSGNILDGGDLVDDMPLFRVKIESLSITAVQPLFTVFDASNRKALAGLSNVDNTADADKEVLSASKLQNASDIGGAKKPVYFNANGVPVAGTYTLGDACAKAVSTSVVSGDANLVTGGAVSNAITTATNYSSGTFTASMKTSSSGSIVGSGYGRYRKIGQICYISIVGTVTTKSGTTAQTITYASGLPFVCYWDDQAATPIPMFNTKYVVPEISVDKYSIACGSGSAMDNLSMATVPGKMIVFYINGMYMTL